MSARRKVPVSTDLAQQLFHLPIAELSPIQETAMRLYMLEMNVFPQPYGKKGGYPWAMLQYTRLLPEDIYPLFRTNCNIAIMTGRTSGNLFVIDCETTAAFTHYSDLLREAHIPIWSVLSGGKRGGGHLYLRCKEGEIQNIRPGERREYEVRGNRCYVLCPPSLHPETRNTYEWGERETTEPPLINLKQMQWLGLSIHRAQTPYREPQPLSTATLEFLANGASEGERNNRLFTAACDLAGNDHDEATAQSRLLPIALKIGLTERETRDTIRSAYSRPRDPAKPTAAKEHRPPSWQLAQAWAESQAWQGRTGQTDRAVFLACCERAKTATDKGIFRASAREIADLARTRPNTASAALKRLETAKFLVFCGRDQGSGGHLYRLSATTTQKLRNRYTTTITSGGDSVSVTQEILFPDAAEWGALHKTAYLVYQCLRQQEQPLKPAAIQEQTQLSAFQVSRALRKLKDFEVVEKNKGKYNAVAMTNADLDERIAQPAGTLGKGELRKMQHQKERAKRAGERLYRARFGKGLVPVL